MAEESNLAKQLEEKNKFTEDELTQVQNIQQSYQNVQIQFGQLKLSQIRLDEQEIELEEALKKWESEMIEPLWGEPRNWMDVTYHIHKRLMQNKEVLYSNPAKMKQVLAKEKQQ